MSGQMRKKVAGTLTTIYPGRLYACAFTTIYGRYARIMRKASLMTVSREVACAVAI
jgi:hypothetical protein